MIYLELSTQGLRVNVSINGVPILQDSSAQGLTTERGVDDWLRSGTNTLTASIDWPADAKGCGDEEASFRVRVCRLDPESTFRLVAAEVYAEFECQYPAGGEDVSQPLPLEVCESFELPESAELRLWKEVQPVGELTDSDMGTIVELIEQLRLAILEGRPGEAFELSEMKFEDHAKASGIDLGELRDEIVDQFESIGSKEDVESEAVDSSLLELQICGEGQLVHVTRTGSPDALDFVSAGMRAGIDVYVGRVANRWTIVH